MKADHYANPNKLPGYDPLEKWACVAQELAAKLKAANGRVKELREDLDHANERNANERIKRLEETLIGAWEIISNVSGGDWTRQKPHWQDYVFQWRDNYFNPIMKELSELKAKEDKP